MIGGLLLNALRKKRKEARLSAKYAKVKIPKMPVKPLPLQASDTARAARGRGLGMGRGGGRFKNNVMSDYEPGDRAAAALNNLGLGRKIKVRTSKG